MAIPAVAPDPFDKDINALLQDPSFTEHLDDIRGRLARGEMKKYSNEEVGKRLAERRRARGYSESEETDQDDSQR